MPPSKLKTISALIFKKMLVNSRHFIILRLAMRAAERSRISNLSLDMTDPNMERIDMDKGEKDFKKLIAKIVGQVEVTHVEP